jgi:hypothetical protein
LTNASSAVSEGDTRLSLSKASLSPLVLAAAFALVGCGDGSSLPKVSGSVSVDGQLVEKGSISFIPAAGQGPTTGTEILAGKYTSQAPLGEAKVEIRVPKVVGKKKLYDTADSPVQDVMEELLPARYNEKSELRFESKAGRNEKNWELTTR